MTPKAKILDDVLLAFPDYSSESKQLELYVDASATALGTCLAQKQDDEVRIIAYASSTFNQVERRYSPTERVGSTALRS